MSCYLLAFVVGKFDYISFTTKSGISVRGCVPPGKIHAAKQLTEIGAEALDLYENFFKIKYPLHKLDLVSYHKMKFRAMENWGMITFKRNVFLNDPKTTPSEMI